MPFWLNVSEEKYFRRLISLIYEYLTELLEKNGFEKEPYLQEGNMLSAGFYNYINEKKDAYLEHEQQSSHTLVLNQAHTLFLPQSQE